MMVLYGEEETTYDGKVVGEITSDVWALSVYLIVIVCSLLGGRRRYLTIIN